mmetsp:Transcript_13848/g.25940  ORF Transcript_13848/g.25940 Transcript_13848/m.25940 type:complete len:236 (+) Transcript_13848:34-741(+)
MMVPGTHAAHALISAALLSACSPVAAETAIINLIRHGEKCKKSGTGLTEIGKQRASYLGQCMSTGSRSDVMPFGRATAVMASLVRPGKSSRPRDTVVPLSEALGLDLQMPCDKKDADCFAKHARALIAPQGSLVVAWQHEDIPQLVKALDVPHADATTFKKWPKNCPSKTFAEPACVYGDSECYDLVWQITMTRPDSSIEWRASGIRELHEGFAGNTSGTCNEGLAPERFSDLFT